MPIFQVNSKLHYFCHIPKCAGASIEMYLRTRFGDLAFQNSKYFRKPENERSTKSSPQHVDAEALLLLFPKNWIRSSFAVVRHPISRIRSAFDYSIQGESNNGENVEINVGSGMVKSRFDEPHRYDNHFTPRSRNGLPDTKIFRLEDELEDVVSYLDNLEGRKSKIREWPHENSSRGGESYLRRQTPLNDRSIKIIRNIYGKDFARLVTSVKMFFIYRLLKQTSRRKKNQFGRRFSISKAVEPYYQST